MANIEPCPYCDSKCYIQKWSVCVGDRLQIVCNKSCGYKSRLLEEAMEAEAIADHNEVSRARVAVKKMRKTDDGEPAIPSMVVWSILDKSILPCGGLVTAIDTIGIIVDGQPLHKGERIYAVKENADKAAKENAND